MGNRHPELDLGPRPLPMSLRGGTKPVLSEVEWVAISVQ